MNSSFNLGDTMLFWVFFYFLDPGYDGSVSITNPYLRENKLFETEILQCQAQEGQCLIFLNWNTVDVQYYVSFEGTM